MKFKSEREKEPGKRDNLEDHVEKKYFFSTPQIVFFACVVVAANMFVFMFYATRYLK